MACAWAVSRLCQQSLPLSVFVVGCTTKATDLGSWMCQFVAMSALRVVQQVQGVSASTYPCEGQAGREDVANASCQQGCGEQGVGGGHGAIQVLEGVGGILQPALRGRQQQVHVQQLRP